jgi:hypothetical protein
VDQVMPDAQDELNAAVERLCEIAERQRDQTLAHLMAVARMGDESGVPVSERRAAVAEGALAYADWTRSLDGYRSLLRRSGAPVVRMRR